jgi:hypothetical protein
LKICAQSKQIASLTKQLAEVRGPRVIVDNTITARAHQVVLAAAGEIESTMADVAAKTAEMSVRLSLLESK